MIMEWDSFIKKEELEVSPGVIDEELIQALSINTYLEYIGGLIEMGESLFPEEVYDQLESVMMTNYVCLTKILEGRRPETEEISAYLELPENVETIRNLTNLCVNYNINTWPEELKRIRAMLPMEKLKKIDWESEERKQAVEKFRKRFEKDGFIEL